MMRILAIDYGEKRIGLALSDPLGFTAQGLETILKVSKENFLQKITELCRERSVTEVIIGLPVNMNGTMGPKAKEILEIVPELQAKLEVPVKTWDERLTSREAGRLMIEEGLSRDKQKQNSDRLAATILLQNYLESRRSRSS